MSELLFEIGCEEIPAGFIEPALNAMKERLADSLKALGLEHGEIRTFGTPRRLGLVLDGLPTRQADREEKAYGPKVQICFDADGNPTKAVQGFARGQGVAVEDLQQVEGPKGRCVMALRQVEGRPTPDLLPEVLSDLVRHVPFRKSMHWGSLDESFARPVHWILALLDGAVVPFRFAGIESGNESRGHRFAAPDPFPVKDSKEFFARLENAYVVVDAEERRDRIRAACERLAKEAGGREVAGEDLIREVANLVEYPFPALGSFEEEFLLVPAQILVNSMTSHQRYFPIDDGKGNLLPRFIVVSNTPVEDVSVAVRGNERVLRARLADARFFYREDRKKTLDDFAEGLSRVTFEEKLGTLAEKVERIKEHLRYLSPFIREDALSPALRAAEICKADLLTNIVGEFPDLQGEMGRIYAELEGEEREVFEAIEQHYRPRFAEDELPKTDTACLLALADKMDTIAGCFGVGLIPSGAADPYALRRQALGILRMLIDRNYRVPLSDWIAFSLSALTSKLTRDAQEVAGDLASFFEGRYRNMRKNDFEPDAIAAVLGAGFDVLPETENKLSALTEFQKKEEFRELAAAFKRVMNILKERPEGVIDPDLFAHEAESELWKRYQQVRDVAGVAFRESRYLDSLEAMVGLKEPVDRFFDDVLVMDKDEQIRNNRLILLGHLADLFLNVADFKKIQTD